MSGDNQSRSSRVISCMAARKHPRIPSLEVVALTEETDQECPAKKARKDDESAKNNSGAAASGVPNPPAQGGIAGTHDPNYQTLAGVAGEVFGPYDSFEPHDVVLAQIRSAVEYDNKMPADKDTWTFQSIGAPFLEKPVKCLGQQNMYVALWYKHGKPIHGRSWNNGGVVECSFPYNTAELKTKEQLEGQIQVLTYKGDHNDLGFWYNWIKYSDRSDNSEKARETVRCGDSFPILWHDRPEGALLGFVDNKTEIAVFFCDGKVYQKSGGELNNMRMIVRELKGGPPNCECKNCAKLPPRPVIRVTLNHWADFRAGDPWPTEQMVQALGKRLITIPGQNPDQYVALWYQAGEPVMGRIWNEGGKIAANFGWGGNEYKTNIGSIQILMYPSSDIRGFDYEWKPVKPAPIFGRNKWHPVHVNHHKGDISPGVLTINGKQILGKVDVRNERATVAFDGKEQVLVGPAVHPVMVLCRKANTDF